MEGWYKESSKSLFTGFITYTEECYGESSYSLCHGFVTYI